MALTINQCYDIVNEISKQSYGEGAIKAVNRQGLISLGDKVLSSTTDKEKFMDNLTNLIGKTIISNRPYTGARKNVVMNLLEYGSITRKLHVKPIKAEKNSSWGEYNIGDPVHGRGNYNPPQALQFMFESRSVYQFPITLPDHQLNTAFESAEGLNSFISAVYVEMENCINQSLDDMINLCVNNFIAEKILYSRKEGVKGQHAINLLAVYNEAYETTLTPANALKDLEFLKFSGMLIRNTIKKMATRNMLFNTKGLLKHTSADYLNVFLLSEYVSAHSTYLQSNTFHKELVELPNFSEVLYWQGLGENGTIADCSTISMITESTGETLTQSYIIGLLCDKEAVGVLYHRKEGKAEYIPYNEITQKWEKVETGFFNDLAENGVVFYLA